MISLSDFELDKSKFIVFISYYLIDRRCKVKGKVKTDGQRLKKRDIFMVLYIISFTKMFIIYEKISI